MIPYFYTLFLRLKNSDLITIFYTETVAAIVNCKLYLKILEKKSNDLFFE